MAQRHSIPWLGLPEDTEESVLGTDLHQEVIRELANGLTLASPQGAEWGIGTQTRIEGFHRRDGTLVPLYPDVFVYEHPTDPLRTTRSLSVDGPPLLIIEVVSESTGAADIDERSGKTYSYGTAGVREFLTFDATRDVVGEHVRAWRRGDDGFAPWLPARDGRWHSLLGVSFAVEGFFLRDYDRDNRRMPLIREIRDLLRGHTEA